MDNQTEQQFEDVQNVNVVQPEQMPNLRKRSRKVLYVLVGAFLVVLVFVVVAGVLNREWIDDFFRGQNYQPTSEMKEIRESLDLTERGEFLFNASQPALSQKDEFNETCLASEVTVAVLGCYTGRNIYVYDIDENELAGIRELTTAHELLHAVYARLSEAEKDKLTPLLEKVYLENEDILKDDIETYDEAERIEELYTRAGTEVKNLPEELEKHYAEIFKDQDKVVDFYDSYIGVFKEIEAKIKALGEELGTLGEEINLKTYEYGRRSGQLEADIISFNSCAEVPGCFKSEADFYARRAQLISDQEALDLFYDEISELIDEYNLKVNEYNENVLHHQELNYKINSNVEIKDSIKEE